MLKSIFFITPFVKLFYHTAGPVARLPDGGPTPAGEEDVDAGESEQEEGESGHCELRGCRCLTSSLYLAMVPVARVRRNGWGAESPSATLRH